MAISPQNGVRYFTASGENIRCELCPHFCSIKPGGSGLCHVRFNRGGAGDIPCCGMVSALAADPIEKKPLYLLRYGKIFLLPLRARRNEP